MMLKVISRTECLVDLHRTGDLELVREILTWPGMYEQMGDDSLPPEHAYEVPDDPRIWYVVATNGSRLVGLFVLIPQNLVCWEVHAAMMPWATPREKWAAARALPEWLGDNTECRRLTAAVPANNGPAIVYGTHGIGLRYVGRQPAAFLRGGHLQDLVLLGMPVGG